MICQIRNLVENNHKIVTLVETPGRICCHAVMQLANIYFVWVGDEEGVRRETLGGVATQPQQD